MTKPIQRLTVEQWEQAVDALRHAESDYEVRESDGDPAAKDLLEGIKVLRRLIDSHRPADDWQVIYDQ